MNFEHSWGDGHTILNFQNYIYEHLKSCPSVLTKNAKTEKIDERASSAIPLPVNLDDAMREEITKACESHDKKVDQFNVHCLNVGNAPGLNYPHWFNNQATRYTKVNLGRRWMKNQGFGPDAFLQLSFQFAAATHYGFHVNHYEAGSMARFYKGRTETIRPLTKEAQEAYVFLKKCENDPSIDNLVELAGSLRKAEKVHNTNIKDCLEGNGFDRHLSALKVIADRNHIKVIFCSIKCKFYRQLF